MFIYMKKSAINGRRYETVGKPVAIRLRGNTPAAYAILDKFRDSDLDVVVTQYRARSVEVQRIRFIE